MSVSDDSELDSELGDSDEFTEDLGKQSKSRQQIKERVDQYLTATRLGRMAFIAGDIQLAKDRFNRAMSLEMQTEFENNGDFGVTSSLLSEEMVTRCSSPTDTNTGSSTGNSPHCVYDRLGNMLCRLSQIFEHADGMLGRSPKNSKWYLVMASSLCMINEWGKAEIVYKEGLKACPDDKHLLESLRSLHKVMDSINYLTKKAGHSVTATDSDDTISNSQYLAMSIISTMATGGTSPVNRRPVNKATPRKYGSLPSENLKIPSNSFMSNKIIYGPQITTPPLPSRSRSQSLIPSKAKDCHITKRFSVQQMNQQSLWQSLFSPTLQAQILGKSFSSKTLETLRTINKLAIVDFSALHDNDDEGDPASAQQDDCS